MDGNFRTTMEQRLKRCDTVFFLDYPTEICMQGAMERRGGKREDLPWIEDPERVDEAFLEMIRSYRETARPEVLALLERYPEKMVYIFHSREEGEHFLERL